MGVENGQEGRIEKDTEIHKEEFAACSWDLYSLGLLLDLSKVFDSVNQNILDRNKFSQCLLRKEKSVANNKDD